ncbi:UDP-N-acetylmuramoyl-tripeptide--D-alanyl-D-alanine ligase [Phocaeicola oris]|uniref:UDP-N-acetylmuramoyl-tripeptide--D-alanyl-D- alanine ligase n=1 Tax=Phocaeicola oris TaxID=2896850 RepID=UPI00234ECCCD|nr:UDP-N-acetylmuramoyl-tripeptide--D-alanyl-D-alanine ligase [Phocaeicola oris]MCE2615885.1 UDP-N-acetylmuramoyl-tripeptide--D-alanyl-D-alanine ligase [Phocaeicola oris]
MDISALYKCFEECRRVTTDTRNCPYGSMFFALKGSTFNGNEFADLALEKGCQYAVVDEVKYAEGGNPRIILVEDSLKALQELANYHRKKMGTRIVAITGTNGKTTTKELVSAVLRKRYEVLATEGNLNNAIGVPLTLLQLTEEHELGVVEMGANHPGDIQELVRIAEPDYGLITNVGIAHLQGFGSFEGVLHAKGELYDYLRYGGKHIVFIDKDNKDLDAISHGLTRVTYGTGSAEELYIWGKLGPCNPFLSFDWSHNGHVHTVHTHLVGAYNMKNALAAITIGRFFSISETAICEALEEYVPQNNRSQLVETANNHLIVDAYNANPTSMMAALDNFSAMDVPEKMVILGDMKELGEKSMAEHQKIVDYLKTCKFKKVILIGNEFGKSENNFEHYKDVEEFKTVLTKDILQGKYILIKGSNSMNLAQLKNLL